MTPLLIIAFFPLVIALHEAGHYLTGKLVRLWMPQFQLGTSTSKGWLYLEFRSPSTQFRISPIIMGGSVTCISRCIPEKLKEIENEFGVKAPENIANPSWWRILCAAAGGPLINILAGISFLTLLFTLYDIQIPENSSLSQISVNIVFSESLGWLYSTISAFAVTNLVYAVLNLVPIASTDGFKIAYSLAVIIRGSEFASEENEQFNRRLEMAGNLLLVLLLVILIYPAFAMLFEKFATIH